VTLPVRASEPAAAELREAVRWYEDRRAGLGTELLDAVSAALSLIATNATAGASLSEDGLTRRALMARFPSGRVPHPAGRDRHRGSGPPEASARILEKPKLTVESAQRQASAAAALMMTCAAVGCTPC
jgi:hypothetical protein